MTPSSLERNELDLLLTEGMNLARQLLETSGEFYPFAVVLDRDNLVQHVQAYPDETPEVSAVLDHLTHGLRHSVVSDGYRALALVRHVLVTDVEAHTKADAVSVALEHSLGHSVQCFVPYSRSEEGEYAFGDVRAVPRVRSIFNCG